MTELGSLARILIFLGVLLIVIGGVILLANKIPGMGRLPGDIYIQKKNFSFYFPLTTCIVVSIILSIIFWLFRR
jgi:formate hydrogenlyase subunit 3/multisubunit Na+/H+ antiporter MnhD subunit